MQFIAGEVSLELNSSSLMRLVCHDFWRNRFPKIVISLNSEEQYLLTPYMNRRSSTKCLGSSQVIPILCAQRASNSGNVVSPMQKNRVLVHSIYFLPSLKGFPVTKHQITFIIAGVISGFNRRTPPFFNSFIIVRDSLLIISDISRLPKPKLFMVRTVQPRTSFQFFPSFIVIPVIHNRRIPYC